MTEIKKLTKAEFAKMMGVKFTEIKKEKTQTAISDKNWGEFLDFIDCNKNGSITIVEFMTTMDDLGEADDYDEIKATMQSFHSLDTNQDGKIKKEEFIAVLSKL